jgi:hypothetical protein
MRLGGVASILAFLLVVFMLLVVLVGANETGNSTITLEANIVILALNNTSNESIVSISVSPNYINFGDVIVGEYSDVVNVNITNIGSVKPLRITSELVDSNDEIFKNLKLTYPGGSFKNVNNFTMNLSSTRRVDMKLDLTNFEGQIEDDIIGHVNNVRFIAMAA